MQETLSPAAAFSCLYSLHHRRRSGISLGAGGMPARPAGPASQCLPSLHLVNAHSLCPALRGA